MSHTDTVPAGASRLRKGLRSFSRSGSPVAPFRMMWLSAASLFLLTGCTKSIGPKVVDANYTRYNRVIGDVLREELLLNVVRRRYFESPQFTALGSIALNNSRSGNASASTGGIFSGPFSGLGLGGGASISDSPSFSMTPQQGAEIAGRLHQQVDLKTFSQLADAGYPLDLVVLLLAQDFSGLRGIDVGTGEGFRGGGADYVTMLNSIRQLAGNNDLVITDVIWEEPYFEHAFAPENFTPEGIMGAAAAGNSYASLDDGESYYVTSKTLSPALWISPGARDSGPGRALIRTMGLDPDPVKRVWVLKNIRVLEGAEIEGQQERARDHVRVRTRSFYGVLNLLAYGVEVPNEDAAFSTEKYQEAVADSEVPDIASEFVIRYSDTRPKNAFAMARFQNGWFYIDNNDRSSKRVFNALYDLYNLQVAPASNDTGAPVLTRPVG